ncbi:MAG: hypothetical protein IKX30_03355 [Victivallales bacterium]|nr:hypothetical protein [Victivallales bacterium]
MKKKLMLLILCLIGVMTLLNAEDATIALPPENKAANEKAVPIAVPDGYEPFPECRLYSVSVPYMGGAVAPGQENAKHMKFFKETLEKMGSLTSVAAFHDKKAKLDTKQAAPDGVVYNMISWSGAFLVKKAGKYTFLATSPSVLGERSNFSFDTSHGIAVFVNGKGKYAAGQNALQSTLDVDLKAGMADLKIVVYTKDHNLLTTEIPVVRYKLQNAVGDYREITPANLYHKTEEEDW